MEKTYKNILMFIILVGIGLFIPNDMVLAANPYSVEMVSNSANNKVIGTYSNYNDAVKAMNNQNSTSLSVASIYKNGQIINSKYAIFRLKANTGTVNLYQNSSDSNAYTYTNPSSMTDTAFLDSTESKVQIMLNGFKGYMDISAGNIIPISLLGANAINIKASGLNLRSDHSTSSSSIDSITCDNAIFAYYDKYSDSKYTWYKINYGGKIGWVANGNWLYEVSGNSLNTYYYRYSTGNLLHRYAYHNGTGYADYFTNLGPTPSYLKENVHYYSFDGGIYFYNDLVSMLDDYKSNAYNHSINSNNPNYPYYLYLPNKSKTKLSASDLDKYITNTSSKMYGQGKYFKEAESTYGINALLAFALAKNESASGTSTLAKNKNNIFGYGAVDSDPYNKAYGYDSVRDSIIDYATHIYSYMNASAKYYFGTHAGTKGSGRNVKYASDPLWGEKMANNAFMIDKNAGLIDYKSNTVAVSKYGKYNLPVYKDANSNNVIYYMRNSNSNFKVYNVPVTVLEKVGDYYKINADSDTYTYGYVKASDFNINNNAPVITASDKTINLGDKFNYMDGVKASDSENGDLTNKVSYDSTVNSNKAGDYTVTYKVTDNSNFTVSKTIKVTVKGEIMPLIEAADKEVSQYTNFNYLDGVKASYNNQDITSNITYDNTVDTHKTGEYTVIYKVTYNNKETTKTIKVKVIENEKPIIEASDKTINLNSEFNPLNNIKASDKEDGDLTNNIKVVSNNVDTSLKGEYSVTYEVSDSALQKVEKKINVKVVEKQLEKVDGDFYLDLLDYNNGFNVQGYLIQKNVSNSLNDNITFSLIFVNKTDNKEYKIPVDRWTKDTPYDLSGKFDYTGVWFKDTLDLSILPAGDYDIYMQSESDDYYTKVLFDNIMNAKVKQRTIVNGDSYTFKVSQGLKSKAIKLFKRNSVITESSSPTFRNMINDYDNIEFEDNNMRIVGTSYNYGGDYSNASKISREVIFENVISFEQFKFDLGSTDIGSYNVKSLDNFSKKYAWFNKSFDISSLPKGTYSIIIHTKAFDVDDYGDMVDMFGSASANAKINSKNYKISTNKTRENRVELTIE